MIILHTLHWTKFAGTERFCVDLCNELSKENKVFLLTNENIKTYINNDVNFIDLDFEKNRYNPFFLYKVAQVIKKINPDIIHIHNTKELEIMYNARFFLNKKIPIIGTKHTLSPKKRFALADLAVGILEETHSIIESQNTLIIKNGMAYTKPNPVKKENKFHIISAARLTPAKGMDIIIKALALVEFNYKFSIFGQGEQEDELNDLIKSFNLENKIIIEGFVNNLNDHLASADLQIIASIFEPYGLTAIDGIYYSNVLISSDTGICGDILDRDLIFDNTPEGLADKLTEVFNNYEHYLNAFKKVKDRKEDFSIEKMTKKYVEAYKTLL